MIHRAEAVLFDMDGTLSDTIPDVLVTFNRILAKFEQPLIPDTRALIRLFGPTEEEILQRLLPGLSAQDIRRELAAAISAGEPLACVAEMTGVMASCRSAGRKVGVFTGAGRLFGGARLERLGIAGEVDAFVAGDDVEHRKPHPVGLLLLCEKVGVAPERAVYIGDSPLDIRCAQAAGAMNIAVSWGVTEKQELAAASPDALVETVGELRRVLGV
jgi:HAD superfamily hydrolase (TIGR01509 family)